ncbi:hypothetical protein M5362_18415 [Streptomyces sp. Je 1-79]|uniref:hypothetical protein n=1 Tax=Streptomyces sp. Je 1-79 TaxID=2943847 RepID=UPI0021A8424F|nr:hypothetical protein [Streptomyces sp. Je 1-79]MCT4355108.1 hypothetical protein [Streptomyces sp. Je 1-79]
MSVHRRFGTAAGAALLTLTVAGCSGLGRTAVGTITYDTEREVVITVTSPLVTGCHRLAPSGVTGVTNRSLLDIRMYTNRQCQGDYIYVPTLTSDAIVPDTLPWRSYSIVH